MANRYRAEQEIELCGKKILLRGTFEGLAEIESRAGISVFKLLLSCRNQTLTLRQATAVIYGGLLGAGKSREDLDYDKIGQDVVTTGIAKLLIPIYFFIAAAVGGNPDNEDNEKKNQVAKKSTGRRKKTSK